MHIATVDPALLDAQFSAYYRSDAPGFAIGIALEGAPAYRRGYGLATLDPARALSTSSPMRIWSITKHFTCLAILLCAERGLLALDQSVRTYIQELPTWADAISLRQLMGHISGMRCSFDLLQLTSSFINCQAPDGSLFDLLTRLEDVNAPAGNSFSYNNGGYTLLSEVIARLSGKSFAAFLKSEILGPVGMKDSFICPSDLDASPGMAQSYRKRDDQFVATPSRSATLGEGALVSTIDDMLRWMAHMDAPAVGTPDSWATMRTAMHLNNGASTGYGMGLMIKNYRGLATISHSGAGRCGSAQMIRLPDIGLDVVVMSNNSDISATTIAAQAIDLCVEGLAPPPAPVTPPATGIYFDWTSARLLELDVEKGVMLNGTPLAPLLPVNDGRVLVAVNVTLGGKLSLVVNAEAMLLEEFGAEHRFDRLPCPVDDGGDDNVAGYYACDMVGAVATIVRLTPDTARLLIKGPVGEACYNLVRKGTSIWIGQTSDDLPGPGCLIESDGEGFWLSSMRTVRLRFKRQAFNLSSPW